MKHESPKSRQRSAAAEPDVLDLFRDLEAPPVTDSEVEQMRHSVLELTRLADRGLLAESSGAWSIDSAPMMRPRWQAMVAVAAGILLVALASLRLPLLVAPAVSVEAAAQPALQQHASQQGVVIQSPAALDPRRAARAFPTRATTGATGQEWQQPAATLTDAAQATAIEDVREMLDQLPLVDEIFDEVTADGAARVVYHQDDLDVVMLLGRGPRLQSAPSGGR